jgi:hypothetical protein
LPEGEIVPPPVADAEMKNDPSLVASLLKLEKSPSL